MDNQINLSICQDCKQQAAVYGDGSTWSRCSKCQYEFTKNNPQPASPPPVESNQSFEHKTVPGLTSIIMPVYMCNYPLFHYTGNAIGAVRAHTQKQVDGQQNYELIVIDNGSPIKTPNLQSFYADKIIVNEENKGVTVAWNQGIRVSFGEYIVLLNNDTQVYEHWLEDMKKCLDEGGLDLVMATPMYSLTEPFARWVEAEKIRDRWMGKPVTESFSDFKDFACVMFKKSLIDQIGAFNEEFFNYASDSDFIKRMEQAGLKWASTKAVSIHHIIDATGNYVEETPEIMNKDKAHFDELWNRPQPPAESVLGRDGGDTVGGLTFVRSNETGDKIFYIEGKISHWVKNPETLTALGGNFDIVQTLTKEELGEYQTGDPIDMASVERYAQV